MQKRRLRRRDAARSQLATLTSFGALHFLTMGDRQERSRSPGVGARQREAHGGQALPAANQAQAAGARAGTPADDGNTVKICSENFCFKSVKGVLLQEVKMVYKKHVERMQHVKGGVGGMDTLKEEAKLFESENKVPKWCKAKEVLHSQHRVLQEKASELQVVAMDDRQPRTLRQELLRQCPWLQHVLDRRRVAKDAPAKDIFAAATAEWERLQFLGKYYVAAKQQDLSREAFSSGPLKAELEQHLDKLLVAVSELTGESVESLKPKYKAERDELHAFADVVQKSLATRAAAERMRQTKQDAKAEARMQDAKAKVQAMDLNQVVAASVTQSLLNVLPTCGIRVPKKTQEAMAAAATKPIAGEEVRQAVLQTLTATPDSAGAPNNNRPNKSSTQSKPTAKGKGKGKGRGKGKGTGKQGGKGKAKPGKSKGKSKSLGGGKPKGKGKGSGKSSTKGKGKGKGKQQQGWRPGGAGAGKGKHVGN